MGRQSCQNIQRERVSNYRAFGGYLSLFDLSRLSQNLVYSNEQPFSYVREFREEFPCRIAGKDELVKTVEEYLSKVEGIINSLENIFGTQKNTGGK